jgi:ADP-heptose:LPS heptosyltransferase
MSSSIIYKIADVIQRLKPERTRLRYFRPGRRQKNTLLILKTDAIGDYVLFRDFLADIRRSEKFKNYHITLCGNELWKDLSLEFDKDLVDDFIWIQPLKLHEKAYRNGIIKTLYKRGFERAWYPCYSRTAESDELMLCSGALHTVTFAGDHRNINPARKKNNDRRYHQLIEIKEPLEHDYFRYCDFFESCLGASLAVGKPKLLSKSQAGSGKVVICPGAGVEWRCWPVEHFHQLALYTRNNYGTSYSFHICGSARESALASQMQAMQPAISYTDHCGKLSLAQFAKLLSEADLVIANDSGPLHLAAACGTNVLGLSNGNNYGRFVPYPPDIGMPVRVVFPAGLPALVASAEGRKRMQEHDSPLSIREITLQQAIDELDQMPVFKQASKQE